MGEPRGKVFEYTIEVGSDGATSLPGGAAVSLPAEWTPDHLLPLPILVIEVSDTTYPKDRGPKLRLYARAGIRDYWIINLLQNRVEVCRQPHNPTGKRSGWRYADMSFHGPGQRISPLARPQTEFAVDTLLP